MTLRDPRFDDDLPQYNSQAAECELILRRLFPDIHWGVACYETLVQHGRIQPNVRPPEWLRIEAMSKSGHVSRSLEFDRSFFAQVSSPAGLLAVIGERFKRPLRDPKFDHDLTQYNDQAAEYELILRRLFPDIRWRIARYEMLVQQGKLRPYTRPPDWLLIDASSTNGTSSTSTTVDLNFFKHVSSPEALLAIIGERLKRELE